MAHTIVHSPKYAHVAHKNRFKIPQKKNGARGGGGPWPGAFRLQSRRTRFPSLPRSAAPAPGTLGTGVWRVGSLAHAAAWTQSRAFARGGGGKGWQWGNLTACGSNAAQSLRQRGRDPVRAWLEASCGQASRSPRDTQCATTARPPRPGAMLLSVALGANTVPRKRRPFCEQPAGRSEGEPEPTGAVPAASRQVIRGRWLRIGPCPRIPLWRWGAGPGS